MATFARRVDGIPVVASATERDALFPVPERDQRVMIRDGEEQRWNGTAWTNSPAFFAAQRAQGVHWVTDPTYGGTWDGVTNDSAAIIAAANAARAAGGGVVAFPKGAGVGQGLPLYRGVHYRGQGPDNTTLKLPVTPTAHLFIAAADSGFDGTGASGSVTDMNLVGASSGYAAYNGLDFAALSTLQSFTLQNCFITRFKRGYNGTDNDRWPFVTNCRFHNNFIGLWGGEHPIVALCDFRDNYIGLTGRLNDFTCTQVKFTYNAIGVLGIQSTDPEVGAPAGHPTIRNSKFVNCVFWQNTIYGISLRSHNTIIGGMMVGVNGDDRGVVIDGSFIRVTGVLWGQGTPATSFGRCAINIIGTDQVARSHIAITENTVNIHQGREAFIVEGEYDNAGVAVKSITVNYAAITGNSGSALTAFIDGRFARSHLADNTLELGGRFLRARTDLVYSTVQGNTIRGSADIGDAGYIEIPFAGGLGNNIQDNLITVASGVGATSSAFKGDLRRSIFTGNRANGFTAPWAVANSDAESVIANNLPAIGDSAGSVIRGYLDVAAAPVSGTSGTRALFTFPVPNRPSSTLTGQTWLIEVTATNSRSPDSQPGTSTAERALFWVTRYMNQNTVVAKAAVGGWTDTSPDPTGSGRNAVAPNLAIAVDTSGGVSATQTVTISGTLGAGGGVASFLTAHARIIGRYLVAPT